MRKCHLLLIALAWLFAVAHPAIAHHSFAAEFDAKAPITLTGTVTKVEWRNPHAYFYLDVEDEKGQVQSWALELASPNALERRGWRRDSLKDGDVVHVEGSRARDGAFKGSASSVILASGQRLFSVATSSAKDN